MSICPSQSEAKQYQNVGIWSRDRFIEGHARRQVARALKPQKLAAKPFSRKGERDAWLIVVNVLVSDPLFLRSGHSQLIMFL